MRRTLLTVLGLLLPEKGALPLHGAASLGDGHITLFLGPAGAQKTTWAMRCGQLIGERGLSWSEDGLHRLADGCRLHLDASLPISLDDALTFGTLAEELILGPDRQAVITQPSDAGRPQPVHLVLPLSKLQATDESDTRGPSQLVILATDPLGVLPPLARLTKEQALAWYALGYGNHYGPLEHRQAACDLRFTPGFMDTLLPRSLDEYIYLLEDLLESHQTRCYLINAGWHGGTCGLGEPLSSSEESACLTALYHCMDWQPLGAFGLRIPQGHSETAGPWHPRERWSDPSDYATQLETLKQAISAELQSTSDPVRWLAALELS
jgi:phosphoenolpyruvate carboxykinase (ATP)